MKTAEREQLRRTWEARIQNWQQSGLSQTAWCQQNQLPPHLFSYWKRKLVPPRPENKLIPLSVSVQPLPGSVTVHFPGSIRVEATPDMAAMLIKALQGSL